MNRYRTERGGILAGVLAAFLILAALAVVGVFVAGMYVAKNTHVEKTRNAKGDETVQVDTPIGSMRVQSQKKLDPKAIGVPVYPNAARHDDNPGASVDFSFGDGHKEFSILAAEYTTDDSVEKVKEFYHHELPHWMITQRFNGSVHMEYTEDGYKRIIVINEKNGQTHIALASVGEPASN